MGFPHRPRVRRGLGVVALASLAVTGIAPPLAAAADPASTSSSGVVDPRTLPRDQRPESTPEVTAKADAKGVTVRWSDVPENAATFRVDRTSGGVTTTVADDVKSHQFVDTTAVSGTDYTYTVEVASVRAPAQRSTEGAAKAPAGPKAAEGQSLGSATVTAKTVAARAPHTAAGPSAKAPRTHTRPDKSRTTRAPASASANVPTANVLAAECQLAGTQTVNATWSPATCPTGYEVTADVVIPDGVTISVAPKTEIYFDTTTESTPTGPTSKIDMVVQGTLDLQSTASGHVLFSSINAHPIETSGTPFSGDWGALYWDGSDGGTAPGGDLSFADVRYGMSVIGDTYALPISDAVIDHMSGIDTDYRSGLGAWVGIGQRHRGGRYGGERASGVCLRTSELVDSQER